MQSVSSGAGVQPRDSRVLFAIAKEQFNNYKGIFLNSVCPVPRSLSPNENVEMVLTYLRSGQDHREHIPFGAS
jgi:hypothetical protein